MEALYGSASPMWTTIPSAGFAFQPPLAMGTGPIAPSVFGPSTVPAATGGMTSGAPPMSLSTPSPPGAYYGPGLLTIAPHGLAGLTAASLLTAVAMRRGQPQGPNNDQEVEDFIYDALELLPGGADVEIRCESGRATLTGSVQHKRVKHDAGEIAWTIPGIQDVQNNVTIASRRRARASNREGETTATGPARKQP
jgi:hypothetical protein